MASQIELLLLRNVEHLGIVGDVVRVRPGYARNYLLPLRMAEAPTPEKIEALKGARAEALAEVARVRAHRAETITKLEGHAITLVRACNDQGQLYGAVTQRDICDQLVAEGFGVDMRAIRLANPVRRVSTAHCTVQFDKDLIAEITVVVKPDRALDLEMESRSSRGDHAGDGDGDGNDNGSAEGDAGTAGGVPAEPARA